jgi:hypothetical protein
MGLIGRVLGGPGMVTTLGETVRDVSEVFTENATRRMELEAGAQAAALAQHSAEFAGAGTGWFDRLVNGLNRLPRPLLAFGTLALFGYAMVDPEGFGARMTGLNQVPEPLWWLLGAIVGFYFGAREAHHFRARAPVPAAPGATEQTGRKRPPFGAGRASPRPPVLDDEPNAALDDWRRSLGVTPQEGGRAAS